jgi:hypothetical protein
MSLLLNGSRTLTIAGTTLQCVEIYTGESYTIPVEFKASNGIALNCSGWALSTSAKFYRGVVTYPNSSTASISGLTKITPQPSIGSGNYSSGLTASYTNASNGQAYLYIPANLADGTGSPDPTPLPDLTDTDSVLVIVTLKITRTDTLSGLTDISREPIGFIVRYQ